MPNQKITSIGGQALMEGILMVGPKKRCAAFCEPDGKISTEEIEFLPLSKKYPILGKPFIRGIFSMVDSMRCGYKALALSADKILTEDEEEESKFDKWLNDKLGDKATGIIMSIAGVVGTVLAIGLFFFLPSLIFNLIQNAAGGTLSFWRSPFEGLFRALIFILYLFFVGQMKDIKRLFMFHGAEHKTIFCYENNLELTVENVRAQVRFHPRCGTSFIVILLLLSILVGFAIPFTNPILRTAAKLVTIPIVMSIGYELLKLCGKYNNKFTIIIAAPGLWVQRLTTKEPSEDRMIEAAIEAMKAVIPENGEDLIA